MKASAHDNERDLESCEGKSCVVEVGPYSFPDNSAPGRRVLATAQLVEAAGCRMVLGAGNPTADGRPKQIPGEPFEVFHLSESPSPTAPKPLRLLRPFIWGRRAAEWLANLNPTPRAVIQYGGYSPFCLRMLRCLRGLQVPLIIDVVEWYQPCHMPGGRFGPYRLNLELAIRLIYPKARNIIAISRLLQRHFEEKGCHVLYLPAILDTRPITPRLEAGGAPGPLRIAYTGSPGQKDLLDPMVEALMRLDPEGHTFRFYIVGPSKRFLLDLPALRKRDLTQLPACLEAPGYVTNTEAMAFVRDSDFSLLLRHRQRYAMAGFPTKVPESLAVGTPVICNLTSDLGDFLQDGVHALVCLEPTPEQCLQLLQRAASLNENQRLAMRHAARKLAEDSFDFRNHKKAMRAFLDGLRLP